MWTSAQTWTARVALGGPGPADGWIAPSLGVRVPAPRLTLTCSASAPPVQLLVVLAHRSSGGAGTACAALARACDALVEGRVATSRPDFTAIRQLVARACPIDSQP